MDYRKYEIWHDENRQGGYYHGVLLIPLDKRAELIRLLKIIRDEHGISYDENLKFAGSLDSEIRGRIISNQLALFAHVIMTKRGQTTPIIHVTGKSRHYKAYKPYLEIQDNFQARFGLLKIADNLKSFSNMSYAKKVEMTFNFVLRGCCHGMFSNENPIEICCLNFDGNEHHKGGIDLSNLIKGEIRPYCKIPKGIALDDKQISERDTDTKLLMNLTDNIIGAWRALLDGEKDQYNVLFPLHEIYKRIRENKIFSNVNGRWYKSISISELAIENERINFPDIFRNPDQQGLGF